MTQTAISVPRVGRRKRFRLMRNEVIWGYLFIVPWALGFIMFTAGPMIASAIFSFMKYDIVQPMKWLGLVNYSRLLQDALIGAVAGGAGIDDLIAVGGGVLKVELLFEDFREQLIELDGKTFGEGITENEDAVFTGWFLVGVFRAADAA